MRTYLGSGLIIKNAIKKYGIDNFHREILCECDNKEELEENEIYYIGVLNTTYPKGYNISKTSFGGDNITNHPNRKEITKQRLKKVREFNRDEKWRKNIGDKLRGKGLTYDHKAKIKDSKNKNPYKHSEIVIKHIKEKLKGRKLSQEHRDNISKGLKDKSKSAAHIESIRQTLTGRKRPKSVIEKMSSTMRTKYENGWKSPVQIEIHQYSIKTGDYIQSFKSATDAGKILGFDRNAITRNCNGKSKTSNGFIWSKIKKDNINE